VSVYAGPEIASSGLVLAIDALNSKSYPGSGTTVSNLASSSFSGAMQNSITHSTSKFSLDGVDDRIYFNLGTNTAVRCYDSTIVFCVNLPVVSGGQRCILSYRGGAGGDLYIGKQNSAIFSYYNELNNASYNIGTITANTPFVCAITLDATNTTITHYINGVSAGGVARTGWVSAYNDTLYLGYDFGGTNEFMIGDFYTFLHYNRVLTATEIKQNYYALRGRFGI
jgi:hypothetical protein